MNQYYVHCNGAAWFVKEAEFFKEQGGLTETWGKAWKVVYADSIEHARLVAQVDAIGGPLTLRKLALEAIG